VQQNTLKHLHKVPGQKRLVNFLKHEKNIKKNKNQKININKICEECKKEHESVLQNLILTSFKICNSCKISKTLFPL
jgi:hypothetical protein